MALTAKQELFVKYYLISLNATQAALEAGYSEKTARFMGHENLTKPNISEAIAEAQNARHKRVEWTADEILRDLKIIATDDNNPLKERIKAYELGGKTAGMFKEKVEMTGSEGGPLKVIFDAGMG